jgi:hypothetical protein
MIASGAVATLVATSFVSFLAGVVFRKWPEKVQEYTEGMDGFALLLGPEAHRSMIRTCGSALLVASFAVLLAAGLVS